MLSLYIDVVVLVVVWQIDDVLTEHTDLAKDRRKDITMMVSVFVTITAMIGSYTFLYGRRECTCFMSCDFPGAGGN